MMQKITDTASDVADQGKQVVNRLVEGAGETGEKVQKWAGEAYDATSKSMHEAYDVTAKKMDEYTHELTQMVRKYPIQSVLIGFGVGLLVSRAIRA